MKKARIFIPLLLVCFLLTGCQFYFHINLPKESEAEQQLPIGTDIDPKLTAKDLYWSTSYAARNRPLHYHTKATIPLTFLDSDYGSIDLCHERDVILDPDISAVNVQTSIAMDNEEPDIYWEYYRDEDNRLILYYYEETTGDCSREEIPLNGNTPFAIILDYTIERYPYYAEDLALEPQTRILDEREVYVLTCRQAATYVLGTTGNVATDKLLAQRKIASTWYIDTESHQPVRQIIVLTEVDDLLGSVIDSIYGIGASEAQVSIDGLTLQVDYLSFEPVELPPVPEAVYRKAWNNAGFSAS